MVFTYSGDAIFCAVGSFLSMRTVDRSAQLIFGSLLQKKAGLHERLLLLLTAGDTSSYVYTPSLGTLIG